VTKRDVRAGDRVVMTVMLAGALLSVGVGSARAGEGAAPAQWTQAEMKKGYVVFEHNAMARLEASHVPAREAVVKEISCALARGEYESVQIGVHALADGVKDVRIKVDTDLDVTAYHRISPSVKAELVKEEMTWISWMPAEVYLEREEVVDEVPKGKSVNFWLTFRADGETAEGLHNGKIRILVGGKPATVVGLAVRVRPFELASPRAAFGMYHREDMLPKRLGSWGIAAKTASTLYRDMAAHAQNAVTFNNAGNFKELPPRNTRLPERVGLATEAGLIHANVPCLLVQGTIAEIEEGQTAAAVAWLEGLHREHGWPEMVNYGWDEPPYPAPGLRERYLPMRDVSMRLGTAMNSTAAYAHGDVHDVWIVIGGGITPEMQAEAERLGAQVWTYSYRIWREGFKPLRQRYYAGLYTWANKLGGNFVWAYSHGHHGHVWWKPGSDEPMPTTAWEARREGVNDYRYLQMAEDCAAANEDDPTAAEAAAWLDALRARLAPFDPHLAEAGKPLSLDEYDEILTTAARYIEKLGAPDPAGAGWPVTNLKDEAAVFRGKSVGECIEGLRSADTSERRAAARALFELGPKGAAGVDALVALLDDAEVRFPALRALERIGPAAHPAVPRLTSLLSDRDSFLRLGATFALAGIARQSSWDDDVSGYLPDDPSPHARTLVAPLRQALRDDDHEVVKIAALGIFRCGEAAAPALPDAMNLLGLGDDGRPKDDGSLKEFGLRALCGMGGKAASAVPILVKAYEAAKGEDMLVTRTLAAMGPAASEAIPALEKHRTPENRFLADTCYALYCIRGGEEELQTLAEIIGDKDRPRGYESGAWRDAARFLKALGVEAAPVAGVVRERLALLEKAPSMKRNIESVFFKRVEEGAPALRLLPR